jgi:hypothetical protein
MLIGEHCGKAQLIRRAQHFREEFLACGRELPKAPAAIARHVFLRDPAFGSHPLDRSADLGGRTCKLPRDRGLIAPIAGR